MRRDLKKAISVVLALLFALLSATVFADEEVNDEFFPDIVIDDVRYYDMLGKNDTSGFLKGFDQFALKYLQKQTKNGSTTERSVMEEWSRVAERVIASATSSTGGDMYKIQWNAVNKNWGFKSGAKTQEGTGISTSPYDAMIRTWAALDENEKEGRYHVGPGWDTLSHDNGTSVYYWKKAEKSDEAFDGYGLIFYNFRFAHVLNDRYIEESIMDRPDYVLRLGEANSTYGQQFTNNTPLTAQASAQLSLKVAESVTLSQTHSESMTNSNTISIKASTAIGPETKIFHTGGANEGLLNLELGYSHTWSHVVGQSFTSGKTYSEEKTNSSTLSVALPPYTQAQIIQSEGKGTMQLKFDMPIVLLYDVAIVYFCKDDEKYQTAETNYWTWVLKYEASAARNSSSAREDLYQRVIAGSTEPYGVTNSGASMKEIANEIWLNVPLSKADTDMSYGINYTASRLSDVRPIANLEKVCLKDKQITLTLKVGEPLDVSTIEVLGLNADDQPFYGFNTALGEWTLLDQEGDPISGNANEYMKLETDAVTNRLTLTALLPGGTAYLKYNVLDNTYIDVEETSIGAAEDQVIYTDPGELENTAALIVRTTSDSGSYSIVAEGEILGYVGSEAIALNGKDSPVEAYAEYDGTSTTVPITWRLRYSNGTASIDDDNNLTLLKEGTNQIRAQWGAVHSDWLPVTVKAARKASSLALSDPENILQGWRVSAESNVRTYDLDLLTLVCKDQYEEEMPLPENVTWFVTKDGGEETAVEDPKVFSVSESGEYTICAKAGGIASNALPLSVGDAPHLASLVIEDNKDPKLLGTYKFCSGTNQFDLWDLKVTSLDQYNEPFAGADFAWYVSDDVNGERKLAGHILEIEQPATYSVYAGAMNGETRITSGPLTLNVTTLVTGTALNKSEITIPAGKKEQLSASAVPAGEKDLYTWYSSDETIATVDANGLVTAHAVGSATITARGASKPENYAVCTVTVQDPPVLDGLVISDDPDEPMLSDYILHDREDTFDLSKLTVTGTDQYGERIDVDPASLTWTVSSSDLEGGILTVSTPGSYRISCYEGTVRSNRLVLTVKEARHLAGLTIADSAVAPVLGDYVLCSGTDEFDLNQLTVSAVDQYGGEASYDALTWYANGEPLEDGLLTVRQVGEYTVGAKAEQGNYTVESDTLTLNVTSNVTGVLLEPDPVRLAAGKTAKLTASALPAGEKDLYTWYSSNESIFTVDDEGNVTAVAPGIGTLTVRGGSGEEATCTVEVLEPPVLAKLYLSDDPYYPYLPENYCLYDWPDNTFLLSNLILSGEDQYDDPIDVKPAELTWVVNGRDLEGDAWTVDTAGSYDICCYQTGGSVRSNVLPMTVNPGRHIRTLTIANPMPDRLFPDEYRLGSGTDSFNLLRLDIRAEDEDGKICPFDTLIWYVNGKELVGDVLKVDKIGTYEIQAEIWKNTLIVDSNILTLNVVTRVTGVQLNYERFTMSAGETTDLIAKPLPEGEPDSFSFDSSRPGIASVDENGKITAKLPGETTITATSNSGSGVRAQCVVTVVSPPEGIALEPAEMLLAVGGSFLLNAEIAPEGAPTTVSWVSDDESVAAVDEYGRVTAVSPGTATIRAETHNGLSDECIVRVEEAPDAMDTPEELILGEEEVFNLGERVTLDIPTSRGMERLTYKSKNPAIADVDEFGIVTAKKRGDTSIVVTAYDGSSRTVPVTVKYAPDWIELSPNVMPMAAGEQEKITVTLPSGSAGSITFVSEDERIAQVSEDGVVTALSKGETVITVSTYNGRMAACTVQCEGITPESRALRLPAALKTIGTGAFAGNPARIVFLPDGATVETGAFAGCTNLLIVVTKDASGIEEGAFDREVLVVDALE